jgi:phenylacetate-CoA ligase
VLHALRLLRSASRISREALEAYQSEHLRRLVSHAYERVPFYRRRFQEHGVEPRHIRGIEDLHLLPVITRRELQAAEVRDLVARGVDPDRLITNTTSGSTGQPLQVRRTWLEQNLLYLYRQRAFTTLGMRRPDRVMRIGIARHVHPRDSKRVGRALRALGLYQTRVTVHVHLPPEQIAQAYRSFRPHVVHATPSAMLLLSRALAELGHDGHRPRVLIAGGEVLTETDRARIEGEIGAPVRNIYGSFELAILAWECAQTRQLHTSDDSGIIEVVSKGRAAEPGEAGDVVATNLHALAAPFIRYHHGDLATRGATPCGCGEPFATIAEVRGRSMDYLVLPEGRVLHPYALMRHVMEVGKAWIRQYQLTQERLDRVVLRIAPVGTPPEAELEELRSRFVSSLGPGIDVELQLVSEIPLEPTGKFRVARSLLAGGAGLSEVLSRATAELDVARAAAEI